MTRPVSLYGLKKPNNLLIGVKDAIMGEINNLSEDSFLLGLQTEYQQDMMRKFGNKCICIGATHGTTMYDFLLVTIMVLDDYSEGIPVAWATTNSEDIPQATM